MTTLLDQVTELTENPPNVKKIVQEYLLAKLGNEAIKGQSASSTQADPAPATQTEAATGFVPLESGATQTPPKPVIQPSRVSAEPAPYDPIRGRGVCKVGSFILEVPCFCF